MASRFCVLVLAGSAVLAQEMDPMAPGHGMGMADSNTVTAAEQMPTGEPVTAEAATASQAVAAATPLPTAIMPSDVSDVSGTPGTLVIDTQTPPSPSSSMSWAITTTQAQGDMGHVNMSGMAGTTGGGSPSGTGGAGDSMDSMGSVNGGVRSACNKISIGLLALCLAASAALQM